MDKSADAFRTIGEVAELLNTPAHVLRFWESRFPQIKPIKRAGGRRYYRPADVSLLGGIRKLLHDDGLTIRGVQKLLKEKGLRHVASLSGVAEEGEADATPTQFVDRVWPADADAADEAPMELDAVAPDPVPMTADIHAMPRPQPTRASSMPAAAPRDAGSAREPAATLLRAMDAMRATDKRSELRDVYDRLSALRTRVAQNDDADRA